MNIKQLKQELDSLWIAKKSFAALKKYLIYKNIPYIASGSSRLVFGPIDGCVLKLAKNKKGLAQNNAEADWAIDYYGVINHWFNVSEHDIWIESEYCTKAKTSDFKKILGYSFKFYTNCLQYLKSELFSNNVFRIEKPKGYDDLLKNEDEFFYQIYCLFSNFNIVIDDMCRISSYGINLQGKIVIVDYGLNNLVWEEHYSN